jgi:hypothetical protein
MAAYFGGFSLCQNIAKGVYFARHCDQNKMAVTGKQGAFCKVFR